MDAISFLTPYWSGAEMMRIHLSSIRRFHPDAPILVSKRGGDAGEMAALQREFGIDYWLEDCGYTDAYLRLLQRCRTRFACALDHDTVLMAGLDALLAGLAEGRYDLVGIEERIRLPEEVAEGPWPESNGWLRFAPGCTASNFLLFDWHAFKSRWGLRGVLGSRPEGVRHFEFDYGIGQRLPRHHYLRPYHVRRYGIGNLLSDGGTPVLWHQWYGSYRTRLEQPSVPGEQGLYSHSEAGERALIADYPHLVFADPSPAWGPDRDIETEQRELRSTGQGEWRGPLGGAAAHLRWWASHEFRAAAARLVVRWERSRRP